MITVLNALIVKTKLVQTKTQSKVLVIACLRIEQKLLTLRAIMQTSESESGYIAEIL